MRLDEIELKICTNELTAAQVFTQMRQHVASKSEWISVDGKEFENIGEVLCVNKCGDFLIGYLEGDSCESEGEILDNVTHWMKPAPPQEGK